MGRLEKDKARLRSIPRDYTYSEAKRLLLQLGFREYQKGRTSGSRVKFYRAKDQRVILLHRPHPGDEMGVGTVKDLAGFLRSLGEL